MNQNRTLSKKTMYLACFVMAAMLLPAGVFAGNLTAKQIMEKTIEARKLAGSKATVKLTLYDKQGGKWKKRGETKTIKMQTKMFDGGKTEKKLYRFTAPADISGTGVLAWDYDNKDEQMWIFTPANRRTTKIVSSDKSGNFMGSDFTYADMNAPVLSNYTLSIHKDSVDLGGTSCWAIKVVPNNKTKEEEGYSKKIIYIGKTDFMVRKSKFWDEDNELLKTLRAKNVKLVDKTGKKYRLMYMEMENHQEDTKSVFETTSITFKPGIADKYFKTDELSKP